MKSIGLVILALSLTAGCASISNFVKQQVASQQRLQDAVKNKVYELSVADLRTQVVEYFGGWRSVTPDKRAQKIKENIDQGFVYQGRYYQKYEPGLGDFFSALSTQDESYLKDFFTRANFHTLKDDKDGFKFVFDGMIFEATKIDEKHSKLTVYSFSDVERGPYKLDVNFLALISKYEGLFTIRRGPVLLEESMQYAQRDMQTEIDLFKKIDPQNYEMTSQGI